MVWCGLFYDLSYLKVNAPPLGMIVWRLSSTLCCGITQKTVKFCSSSLFFHLYLNPLTYSPMKSRLFASHFTTYCDHHFSQSSHFFGKAVLYFPVSYSVRFVLFLSWEVTIFVFRVLGTSSNLRKSFRIQTNFRNLYLFRFHVPSLFSLRQLVNIKIIYKLDVHTTWWVSSQACSPFHIVHVRLWGLYVFLHRVQLYAVLCQSSPGLQLSMAGIKVTRRITIAFYCCWQNIEYYVWHQEVSRLWSRGISYRIHRHSYRISSFI